MSYSRAILCLFFSCCPALAVASHGTHEATIRVQVIHSQPVYETVRVNRPIEDCRTERAPARRHGKSFETVNILGAIVGGALGRHLGHGGQEEWLGTFVGGMLGHSMADEIQTHRNTRSHRYPTRVEVCHWIDDWETRREVVGYEVTYELAGREFTSFSAEKPGATMEVALVPSG